MAEFAIHLLKRLTTMLHISDIEKRLKINPEPDEVREMRETLLRHSENLEFVEEGHKYYLHKGGTAKEMTSVTTMCHEFEPEVDWETVLVNKSRRLGIDKEELRRTWRENNITSTSNGTLTHLFGEAYMHFFMGNIDLIPGVILKMQYEDGFLIPYGGKQRAIAKYYEDMFNVENFFPIAPEIRICIDGDDNPFGIKRNISGTVDAPFAFKGRDGKWKVSIRDWKTNKSLEDDWNRKHWNTLLPPFNTVDFINEPKSVYTLQLSIYQLGFEQHGYEVADRKLLWLLEDGEYQKIDTKDVSRTLIERFMTPR